MGLALIQYDLCASEKRHLAPEMETRKGDGVKGEDGLLQAKEPPGGCQTSKMPPGRLLPRALWESMACDPLA